jgi:hypothetical protein
MRPRGAPACTGGLRPETRSSALNKGCHGQPFCCGGMHGGVSLFVPDVPQRYSGATHTALCSMKSLLCPSDVVAAVWAISSPRSIETAAVLPNSPEWKELKGTDTWVYMRLTKTAARALAAQLLHAASSDDPEVVTARPQGAFSDDVSEEPCGFFLHPGGASLTIEVADMPSVEALLRTKLNADASELLSPQPDGRGIFKR